MDANNPISPDGRTYHLQTRKGDIAQHCLLVGSPERAEMIARTMFTYCECVGDHRGLKSYTGKVDDFPISVVTTGMGSASTAIVLPEAVYSGAKRLIRVGSCATLWRDPKPGDSAICTGAVRLDGASENWAPIEYPAVADFRVVSALVVAAQRLGLPHYVGIGTTTTCFNEGQARPDLDGYLPPRLQAIHDELVQRGVLFYSMEEATLFVWCTTHGKDIWAGAIDAIYGNRHTNEFDVRGEEEAARIAIRALLILNEPTRSNYPRC
ncbi:MAG TPA: uridine phosphorylase [Candidatus Magasanikbacteria bacterium]|nr:uridine phosphorylase [Candidatus Magasanikbacteria bacterium]